MEKIIKIDGKDVNFKTNGIALLLYKQQTGRDLMPDLFKLIGSVDPSKINTSTIDVSALDLYVLYDVCWTFAKIADPKIPPVLEWAGEFETFPIVDVFKETIELLMECITCSAEVKKALATASLNQKVKHSKQKISFLQRYK